MSKKHPNISFWITFLLLNFLLFLPIYWFFKANSSFLPIDKSFETEQGSILSTLFLQRENLDIFRLNVEFLFFVLLYLFAPRMRQRWFLLTAFFLFLAQLVYAVYEGFVRAYYFLDPTFYNDFFLFSGGARYALNSLHISPFIYLGAVILIGLIIGILFGLNRLLFNAIQSEKLSGLTKIVLTLTGILAFTQILVVKEASGLPETAVSSFVVKVNQNLQLSRIAKAEADRFDSQDLAPFYQFTDAKLKHKPDIYLIFLESYGSVLYKRRDFNRDYRQLLNDLTQKLDQKGWVTASIRSHAPTWGGGSWLSYTSTMAGLRIDSHAQYLALFSRYHQEPFPHLFNYLRGQGYRSYWLTSNSDELSEIDWQRYKKFYGVDEWLQFADMAYEGPLFGWGPSPPDQYAIHFAHTYMNQGLDTPHVFFYITQNSHYPWSPLPELAESWQMLNDLPYSASSPSNQIAHHILRKQYLASIEYELNMLTNFIVTNGDEEDIFVLVGDHQPARVARYSDGWDTPIHIIAKDASFVESFYAYDFVPGLKIEEENPQMHHEGLYSLFMHNFLQAYGLESEKGPVYLPEGSLIN